MFSSFYTPKYYFYANFRLMNATETFYSIVSAIPGTALGKMFGALCIKAESGKAGVMFYKDELVLKLPAAQEAALLSLPGVRPFAPMEGRVMNGWTKVPFAHTAQWEAYARIAMAHAATLEPAKTISKKKLGMGR